MANVRKRISELPALTPATMDTTFVVGISGSTTYKISINQLTSSLDGQFASDLVTNALSGTLDGKLSTSSFNSYTASISTASLVTSITNLNNATSSYELKGRGILSGSVSYTSLTNIPQGIVSQSTDLTSLNQFTASISTASLINRLNAIENVSGSWITESETGSFLTSLNGAISGAGQIQDLGFVTGSYATTGSNTFIGNQIISGSVVISEGIHNWEFGSDGIIKLNNGTAEIYSSADTGLVRIGTAAENVAPNSQIILGGPDRVLKIKSGPPLREWAFEGNGDFNISGSINGVTNLVTTSSFNSYTASISTASLVTSISNLNNATSSYLTSLSGAISSSSQLTSSFDTRYAISASFVSSSNLSSIRTITSASYAALTPVSGTLYIIIG